MTDSKSVGVKPVWVRVPPSAPNKRHPLLRKAFIFYLMVGTRTGGRNRKVSEEKRSVNGFRRRGRVGALRRSESHHRHQKERHDFHRVSLFVFVSWGTQHRFAVKPQTSFDRKVNIIPPWRTQNDVVLRTNDAMLRINDVLPSAKTMLRLRRKYTLSRGILRFVQMYGMLVLQ